MWPLACSNVCPTFLLNAHSMIGIDDGYRLSAYVALLREMSEPLIPFSAYSPMLDRSESMNSLDIRIKVCLSESTGTAVYMGFERRARGDRFIEQFWQISTLFIKRYWTK
jgi:hypothetical protein